MKPEILLKAYVLYKSEDAFRELVAGSLDEVYSIALRIVQGAQPLAEETVLRVYWELARKAPRLGEDVVLTSWLREYTCKTAVAVLREEDRPVDRAVLRQEKQFPAAPNGGPAAPAGLATRVCQGVFLSTARNKGLRFLLLPALWPAWIRPVHLRAAAACVLVIVVLWKFPFHRGHRIIQSEGVPMTPASFAQLASPDDGVAPAPPDKAAETKIQTKPK